MGYRFGFSNAQSLNFSFKVGQCFKARKFRHENIQNKQCVFILWRFAFCRATLFSNFSITKFQDMIN